MIPRMIRPMKDRSTRSINPRQEKAMIFILSLFILVIPSFSPSTSCVGMTKICTTCSWLCGNQITRLLDGCYHECGKLVVTERLLEVLSHAVSDGRVAQALTTHTHTLACPVGVAVGRGAVLGSVQVETHFLSSLSWSRKSLAIFLASSGGSSATVRAMSSSWSASFFMLLL